MRPTGDGSLIAVRGSGSELHGCLAPRQQTMCGASRAMPPGSTSGPLVRFLHRPRAGRPSLALDLAEEVRALVDRFVVALVRRRQVAADSFVDMPGGGVYLSDDGRTRLIKEWEAHKDAEVHHQVLGRSIGRWALPSVQATLLARHLRGDLPEYAPFVLP